MSRDRRVDAASVHSQGKSWRGRRRWQDTLPAGRFTAQIASTATLYKSRERREWKRRQFPKNIFKSSFGLRTPVTEGPTPSGPLAQPVPHAIRSDNGEFLPGTGNGQRLRSDRKCRECQPEAAEDAGSMKTSSKSATLPVKLAPMCTSEMKGRDGAVNGQQ